MHISIQVGTGDEAAERRTGTPPPRLRELSEGKVNWKEILEGCVQKDDKMERHERGRWAGSRAGGRGWADLEASIERERETPISG